MKTVEEIAAICNDFFDPEDVSFLPLGKAGSKRLAAAYLTARDVMYRLDQAFGPDGWGTRFTPASDGCVQCSLTVRYEKDQEWITRVDVGSPSEQQDAGDRMKAAYSDALKRAAVHFGIFRYAYELDNMYAEFDDGARRFTEKGLRDLRQKLVDFMRKRGWKGEWKGEKQAEPAPEKLTSPVFGIQKETVADIRSLLLGMKDVDEVKILKAYSDRHKKTFSRLEELSQIDGEAIVKKLKDKKNGNGKTV